MCLRRLLAYHEYSLDIFLVPNRVLLCACIFLFSCLMFISRVAGDLALRLSSRSWPLPICDFLLQALRVQAEVLVVSCNVQAAALSNSPPSSVGRAQGS